MEALGMKLHLFLISFLVFSMTATAFAEEPIRVLTFNILYSRWDKPEFPWEKRKSIVVDVMKNYPDGNGPYDFIGTQETANDPEDRRHHQIDYLVDAMPDYGSLYAPCNGRNDKYALTNLIFYKKDRWEIDPKDHGHFWLSGTPEVPGSNTWAESEKGRGGPRCVTYGLFHEIDDKGARTGKKVYFFNTHLNVFLEDVRKRSAVLIMDRIVNRKSQDAPAIITGDFNALQNSPIISYLEGRGSLEIDGKTFKPPIGLIETFKAVHPDSTEFGTTHGYSGSVRKDRKIDFVFATEPLKPVKAKVILTQKDGLYPSDHLPVDAVLQ